MAPFLENLELQGLTQNPTIKWPIVILFNRRLSVLGPHSHVLPRNAFRSSHLLQEDTPQIAQPQKMKSQQFLQSMPNSWVTAGRFWRRDSCLRV